MKHLKKIILILISTLLFAGCALLPAEEEAVLETPLPQSDRPAVMSEFVYLVDRDSGQVLWDCKSEERIYPASMTKLMTAILSLELIEDYEETYKFDEKTLEGLVEAHANRAGFVVGDEPTLLDLVYGDLLPSGADCSRALAYHLAGSEEAFVDLMNEKAKTLGMDHTHFVNTSGLFEEDHYSTCRDIALLLEYCLQNELFTKIIGEVKHTSIPVKHYPKGLDMDNFVMAYINQPEPIFKQLFQIPGFIGGKSGYILESNFSLASAASFNDMNLLLVTCNAYKEGIYPASIDDASAIYNWYRENCIKGTVYDAEQFSLETEIRNCEETEIAFSIDGHLEGDYGTITVRRNLPAVYEAPLHKGDVLGTCEVYEYDQLLASYPIVCESEILTTRLGIATTWARDIFGDGLWIVSVGLLGILMILLICLVNPFRKRSHKAVDR